MSDKQKNYKIAVIAGDGIGKEGRVSHRAGAPQGMRARRIEADLRIDDAEVAK